MPGVPRKLMSWLEGLRFPVLLLITGTLFIVNVLVPDALPFIDEMVLALVTLLLARLKRSRRSNDSGANQDA